MDYRECFQCSIDYIEVNLKSKLTVEELAELAGFSPYHYYRLFNQYVGMPVMEYVRRRRMAYAASELASGRRIIDIAMDYGFDTHNGFCKAFRKEYACSPEQYRVHTTGHIPEKVNLKKLINYKIMGGIVMEPKIITMPSFKVVGYEIKTTTREGQNSKEIPKFWERYMSERMGEKLFNQLKPAQMAEYGMCFPIDMETGDFSYVIGARVDSFENASEDMFKGEVLEATYAVFTTPPADKTDGSFVSAIQGTWEYIYESWLPKSGYEFAPGRVDFELYDERCYCDKDAVMDIYIPIVKRK